jgi:hypothetical protein
MPTVTEGKMAKASDLLFIPNLRSMKYPDINSCLTITLVCKNQMLVGAHAVIMTGEGMESLDKLVDKLKSAAEGHNPLKLFLVGAIAFWNPTNLSGIGSRFSNVDAIATELQTKWPGLEYSKKDVSQWTNGGAVEIKFSPSGPFVVKDQNTGNPLYSEKYWEG